MLVKGIIDEDFINYKVPCMSVMCHTCSFKCDIMANSQVCQNSALAKSPDISIDNDVLVERYVNNQISQAICFCGLEPFDDIANVIDCIRILREQGNNDDVVIYTGYTFFEVTKIFTKDFEKLKQYKNIVLKTGRYIPNREERFDEVLGVKLASENQYAIQIS